MSEVDDLLRALTSESAEGQDSFGLETRTQEFSRTGAPADVVRLLDVVDKHLALHDSGPFMPPASTIILSVISRFPAPALVPKLVALSESCAARERLQIVRSLFEIGVRADDQAAIEAGLQVAGRLALDRVPVGITDPLYWLRREPVHPDIVIPRLAELARLEGWRDEAEATRVAYRSAFPDVAPASSAYTLEELREWVQGRDERLLTVVMQHATNSGADDIEAVQALPAVLRIPLLVSTVEGEILNGGYLQYFWNHGRQTAAAAGDAFDTLRWAEFAQVHRDALAAYDQAEAQLGRLRAEDTLTAYSNAADLGVFDAAEHRFMQLHHQRTVADGLLEWLSSRVDQVAEAIGVQTGSNRPPA